MNSESTFHNAWLHGFTYSIDELYYADENLKQYTAKLEILHSDWKKFFHLSYKNTKIFSFPCNLLYSDFTDLDILYHELTWDDFKKEYRHDIYFAEDRFLSISFQDFHFCEVKRNENPQ